MNPYRYAETCAYCDGHPSHCGGFGRCVGPEPVAEAPKAKEPDAVWDEQRMEWITAMPAVAR